MADELMTYLQGAEVIIHNAAFDVAFLNAELERVKRKPFSSVAGRVTDTLLMARDMFPGKSNSLDALCRRLEVDNTSRTLHGALLDAGLLADVYIRLTRGQDSLVIDGSDGAQAQVTVVKHIDLMALALPVIEPTQAEQRPTKPGSKCWTKPVAARRRGVLPETGVPTLA